jgi:hypothetical protein
MSGFMWQGLGRGIAGAGQALGQGLIDSYLQQQKIDAALAAKEADRQTRLQIEREKADAKAAEIGGIDPNSKEGLIETALRMGVPVSQVQDMLAASQGQPAAQEGLRPVDGYAADKQRALAEIRSSLRLGKNYKDVSEGRVKAAEADVSGRIASGDLTPEEGGAMAAAQSGKSLYSGNESGTTNLFSGEQSMNKLGEAKVKAENALVGERGAQADKARADADTKSRDKNMLNEERKALTYQLQSFDRDLDRLRTQIANTFDDTELAALKREREDVVKARADIRKQLDDNAAAARELDMGAGKRTSPKQLDTLPKGAVQVGTSKGKPVYRLPDGSMIIQQ